MAVLCEYEDNDLPLEALWTDVDSLDRYRPFSIDNATYPDFAQHIFSLHKKNKK